MSEKRYRVEIVETATGKVEAVIGRNLNERQMERRIETGLLKCNTEKYFVREVEEEDGSKR